MPTSDLLSRILGQVGKVLGERWKALNPKQREPYEAKAKTDKERYESEKASYNVSPIAPFYHIYNSVSGLTVCAGIGGG